MYKTDSSTLTLSLTPVKIRLVFVLPGTDPTTAIAKVLGCEVLI